MTSNPAEWAGISAPEGMELAWKAVHPDGRTRGDFTWPFKGVVKAPKSKILPHGTPCPQATGDGLCLAKTWSGAASGGIRAITGLAVAYSPNDVLGQDATKLRVSRCQVVAVLDLQRLLRDGHGKEACLSGADLSGADLYGADLSGANLCGANLRGAYLSGANLSEAYLYGAYLSGAYLYGAYLRGANLRGAYLSGANFRGAYLSEANLRGAYLRGAIMVPAGVAHDKQPS